jgi:hypothetical protein
VEEDRPFPPELRLARQRRPPSASRFHDEYGLGDTHAITAHWANHNRTLVQHRANEYAKQPRVASVVFCTLDDSGAKYRSGPIAAPSSTGEAAASKKSTGRIV